MFSLLIGYISFWQQGYSCAELKEQGLTKSGIYYLLIRGTSFWYIKVYCDMEAANGGWTVKKREKFQSNYTFQFYKTKRNKSTHFHLINLNKIIIAINILKKKESKGKETSLNGLSKGQQSALLLLPSEVITTQRERERERRKRVSGVVDCVGPVLFSLETQKEGEKKEKKKKVRISHPSTHMDGEWNG